ncbi:MAG: hypothetical protein DMG14_30915 [Acidobacteria bacterium]|nr:MAG: hypothetical protein DMG14_30915 [Acidobacteriota bacterium]
MTEHRHETTDMSPKYVLYFAVGLVVLGLLIHVGIWWMFHQFEQAQARRESQPVLVNAPAAVPEPHLQISPQDDLQQLRRQEDEILSTYRWIDRDKGTARIPIDRAMQLFLQRQKK